MRGALYIFHFHAEVIDPFATIARRENSKIDVAVGKINRSPVLARFAAPRDLFETERRFVKLRKFFGILRE